MAANSKCNKAPSQRNMLIHRLWNKHRCSRQSPEEAKIPIEGKWSFVHMHDKKSHWAKLILYHAEWLSYAGNREQEGKEIVAKAGLGGALKYRRTSVLKKKRKYYIHKLQNSFKVLSRWNEEMLIHKERKTV